MFGSVPLHRCDRTTIVTKNCIDLSWSDATLLYSVVVSANCWHFSGRRGCFCSSRLLLLEEIGRNNARLIGRRCCPTCRQCPDHVPLEWQTRTPQKRLYYQMEMSYSGAHHPPPVKNAMRFTTGYYYRLRERFSHVTSPP